MIIRSPDRLSLRNPARCSVMLAVAGLVLMASLGCSGGSEVPRPVKVSGQIQLKGKPVTNARIAYFAVTPAPGLPASERYRKAEIGADGKYAIENVYPGEYVVTIHKFAGKDGAADAADPGDPAFAKYATDSPLRAAVSEEAAQFDFNL